jgi:hypothetical protein
MTIRYNLTGDARKSLVTAIGREVDATANYHGVPTFAYDIGDYHIDKAGTVTGPDDRILIGVLQTTHGFTAVTEEFDITDEEMQLFEREVLGLGRERRDPAGEDGPQASEVPDTDDSVENTYFAVEMPMDGFTPEVLDNLSRLVASKEQLIKKALGVDEIPIKVLQDRIFFAWFNEETDGDKANAYAQFISALCKTAKEKKRVTAKPQESFENEKFAMRVWLIALGLIGKEYSVARKLLCANLSGNSAFRNGPPDKAGATPAVDGLAETLADAELIHAVNASFENGGVGND